MCDFHVVARWVGVSSGAHPQCGQVSQVVSWFGVGTWSREGRFPERHDIVSDDERVDSFAGKVIESLEVLHRDSLEKNFKFTRSVWVINTFNKILWESASRFAWPWLGMVKSLHEGFIIGGISSNIGSVSIS
jgi:hypothetical protein